MTTRFWILMTFAVAISMTAGCNDRRERVVVYEEQSGPVYVEDRDYDDDYDYDDDDFDYDDDDYDDAVVIERTHVCTRGCNHHFYNGSRVVVLRGHRHGPRCGHVWDGRYWIRGPRRAVRTRHVCTRRCNHFWNGSRLINIRGHRHGPGCGHNWNGTYWIAGGRGPIAGPRGGRGSVRGRHVCTTRCNHFWNGSRLINVRGHRHGRGCGHTWNGTYWVVTGGKTVVPKRGRRIR